MLVARDFCLFSFFFFLFRCFVFSSLNFGRFSMDGEKLVARGKFEVSSSFLKYARSMVEFNSNGFFDRVLDRVLSVEVSKRGGIFNWKRRRDEEEARSGENSASSSQWRRSQEFHPPYSNVPVN